MSSIEKLKISGVRSYSSDDAAVIAFFKPLTLIVGPNGAGKTSIIECLKYVTTGDMPPGSKNSYFVNDPKFAKKAEVRAQVKLMFTDISNKSITITRSLVSHQKGRKVETRSLESNIKMEDKHGERKSISSRCAEVNHAMISHLGVSKAVLENVIFCHQEESNWPLSEGKVLKQKFDDIFAATRYIKALETIRKLRLEQSKTVTICEAEIKYLKENRDKAEEVAEQLENREGKIQSTRDSILKISNALEPVEMRMAEIDSVMQEVSECTREIGSSEELQRAYAEFQDKIGEKNSLLQKKEREHQRIVGQQQELTKEKSNVLLEHGKLEQQSQRHKRNLEERNTMVLTLANHYGMSSYSSDRSFTDSTVDGFVEELRKKYCAIIEDTKHKKQLFTEKIDAAQRDVDKIRKTQAEYGETIRIKRDMMRDNQTELKNIGKELSSVDASANRLKSVETDLQRVEKELRETKEQGSVDEMNSEIEKLQNDKRQVDGELSRLREEQQTMHLQSTTQAKLDMLTKEKMEKQDKIQKLMDKHEEDIKTYLGGTRTGESLTGKLNQYIKTKGKDLQDTRHKIQRLKQAQSAKNANKKHIEDLLKQKREQADSFRQQLKEACGDNDYNMIKEQVKNNINDYRDDKSLLVSIESIYKKYIDKLQDDSVKKDGCPLCHRCFSSNKEIKTLVSELSKKITSLPEKRADNESRLENEEVRYQKILNLGPVKDNLEKLESTEISETDSRLTDITMDIDTTGFEITELEDVLSMTEIEESKARQMEPDLREADSLKQGLVELDRNISLNQSKLHGIAPGRTMQAVNNDINDRQDRSETLDRHIDRRRRALTQLQRTISTLESNMNDLKSQKFELKQQLQRRTHLEGQKADLTARNDALGREIKEAEAQAKPIQEQLHQEEAKKQEIVSDKEAMEEENRKILTEIRSNGDKLREKISEIKRYTSEGIETALQDNEERLSNIESREVGLYQKKDSVSNMIDVLKDDITKQEIKARDLEDNIKLKNIEKDINEMESKIKSAEVNLRQYGNQKNLISERQSLQNQSDNMRKEKAQLEGRQKGYEEEIRYLKGELCSDQYSNAESKHREKIIELKTTSMASADLDKYYKALDRAIMKYHSLKMAEINKIIKEYWIHTYKGTDIDHIAIVSDEEEGSGASKARRTYNYRVVMVQEGISLDMRGRCSAGQKVLASIIIRLALAETFCLNCGILALDEPTTNLDEENITSLARQLTSVIRSRHAQKNFQLIVITHDEDFVENLGRADFVDHYYRIDKNKSGHSMIWKQNVGTLNHREESYIEPNETFRGAANGRADDTEDGETRRRKRKA